MKGRNKLFPLRRRIKDTERDRDAFKTAHRLQRSANISSPAKQSIKIGLLLVIAVFEVAVNGAFLAKGNEQGLVGGAVQAVSFALLNVLASFMIGLSAIRLVNHRSLALKMLGLLGVFGYLAFAVSLNLSLAHYREVSGVLSVESGIEVINRLRSFPFALTDITSWIFFGVGLTFSLIAMADGVLFRDPYPGFEAMEKACLAAHQAYTEQVDDLIEDLRGIRDDAREGMREVERDLTLKLGEFDSILQGRLRLNGDFVDFQAQLERTAQALLSIYRVANSRARSTPAPAHFSRPYQLDKISIAEHTGEIGRNELLASIETSQRLLENESKAIHDHFDAAVKTYREIDDIFPEDIDGRSRKRRRSSRSAGLWLGGGLIAFAMLCACGLGLLYFSTPRAVALDDTLCPVDGPRGVTAVLVDTSDDLSEITKHEVTTHLLDIVESLPPYELLDVRCLTPNIRRAVQYLQDAIRVMERDSVSGPRIPGSRAKTGLKTSKDRSAKRLRGV